MVGLIAPLLLALVAARLLGGSPAHLTRRRVRWLGLAVSALLAQVFLFSPLLESQPWVLAWGAWLWDLSMLAVLGMLLRNALAAEPPLRAAWSVAAVGVLANVLVVTANGGVMPRSVSIAHLDQSRLSNVAPATDQARLAFLGDTLAQPEWLPLSNAVSVGDLLLSAGLAWWIFVAARRDTREMPRA